MSASAPAISSLPASASAALRELAGNLKTARLRRGVSLRDWASRMDISVPTLVKMESGDPRVAIGVYATALFLCGMHSSLANVARPEGDLAALAADVARVRGGLRSRRVRS